MASKIASLATLFKPKPKQPRVLACSMPLDPSPHAEHATHGSACFISIAPLMVVELFQSQGCKQCPPVLPVVHKAVASNPNLLLLTYDVTYWDASSGWKDTFGKLQWDARQREYVRRWGRTNIFTPQVIANGASDGIGSSEADIMEIFNKATHAYEAMEWSIGIDFMNGELRISSDRAESQPYDVLVVQYESDTQVVKVGAGPNKRKKIETRNVVREFFKVGEWAGGLVSIRLPEMQKNRFHRVALVQEPMGGPIVAAVKF